MGTISSNSESTLIDLGGTQLKRSMLHLCAPMWGVHAEKVIILLLYQITLRFH